jgi:signal transduction histidine kinase
MQVISLFRRPLARDGGLVLLLVALALLLGVRPFALSPDALKRISAARSEAAWRHDLLRWWAIALPAFAAVPLRRRRPLPAFLVAAAAATAHMLDPSHLAELPTRLAAAITLYTLASVAGSRRVGAAAFGGALVVIYLVELHLVSAAALFALGGPAPGLAELGELTTSAGQSGVLLRALYDAIEPALFLGIAWAAGDSNRSRRLHLAALEQRAADLERERDQRSALAVAAERARINRELHDVVAHGITVMVVQAQGAAAALDNHPDRSSVALANVIDTGRASLAEMRRLLGLAGGGLDSDPRLAPQPGVGALPALIDQVRGAGTAVELRVEGEPVPLPAAVDLSVYRIVQEALTNVRRHAGDSAHATVRLTFQPNGVGIEVSDDGGGRAGSGGVTPPAADGNGLRGIGERVGALGGSLDTGPRTGGGFGVHAHLPLAADR